ncbi:mitochondrial transcription termination factor 5 isoform X2 [Megalopta genalis]|uniref:mitochondrial transcription termination factor 5 isoform X2 n=1 Tax=Megalopta genalis TaxID=115081 RepID=UPI003FD4AA56
MYKLFICKTFVETCYKQSLFYSTKCNIREILTTQLGLDHNTMENILRDKNYNYDTLSEQNITKNCKTLKDLAVEMQNTNFLIDCLRLEPRILTNRILLLEEIGVKTVSLDRIYGFPSSMRKTLKSFKQRYKMPPETDIVKNMLNSVGKSPLSSNALKLQGRAKTADYYILTMTYYKTFYLKVYNKPLLSNAVFKYQSFRQLTGLVDILKTKFQIDKDFLDRHPFLLTLHLDDVNHFLNEFEDIKIHGASMVDLVKKFPRLLQYDVSNIKALRALFEEFNVQEHAVYSNLQILGMGKDSFVKRSLEPLTHPRVARKKYLQSLLNEAFGKDAMQCVSSITRHPHWKNIPFSAMYKMIIYLKENYTLEDILPNIHLILYPLSTVKKMIETVDKEYSLRNKPDYTNSQRLALCLYMLEKSYHFSGDAVWKILYPEESSNKTNPENLETNLENSEECSCNVNTIDKGFNPYMKKL